MALDLNFLKKKYEEMLGGAGNAVMTAGANVQKWFETPDSQLPVPTAPNNTLSGVLINPYLKPAINVTSELLKTGYDVGKAGVGLFTGQTSTPSSKLGQYGQFVADEYARAGYNPIKVAQNSFDTVGNYGTGKWGTPEFGLSESTGARGITSASNAAIMPLQVIGLKNPLTMAGYTLGGGVLGTAFGAFNGKNPYENFIESASAAGDKAAVMTGGGALTNKYVSILGDKVGGNLATTAGLNAFSNMVQGVGLDKVAGYDTTPESMAIDAVFGALGTRGVPTYIKKELSSFAGNVVNSMRKTGIPSDVAVKEFVDVAQKAGIQTDAVTLKQKLEQPEVKAQIQSQPEIKPQETLYAKAMASGNDSRPQTQKILEDLMNAGKNDEAWKIIDSMSDSDPYKATMTNLMNMQSPRPEVGVKSEAEVNKYLEDVNNKQTTKEKVGIKEKAKNFIEQVQTKFEDYTKPIDNAINEAYKTGKLAKEEVGDLHRQIGRLFKIDGPIEMFIKDNGMNKVIQDIGEDRKSFDEYLIAKHAIELESRGIQTGRDIAMDKGIVQSKSAAFEPYAQQVYAYNQKLLSEAVRYGLISQDLADKLLRLYPSYVPIQRVFDLVEEEAMKPRESRGGPASISSQTVIQKLQGSEREIASPLDSIIKNTTLTIKQGERNMAANMLAGYIKKGVLPGTILRDAENVVQRTELYKEVKDLGKYKKQSERLLTTRNKWVRKLVSQINYLNEKGYNIALKSEPQDVVYKPDVVLKTKTPASMVVTDTGDSFYVPYEGGAQRTLISKMPTATQTKKLVNALVNLEPAQLAQIQKRIGIKDKELSGVLDIVQDLKKQIGDIKTQKADTLNQARSLSDIPTQGKHTFSALNNGIKETFETSPEIARAAKNMGTEELPRWLQFVAIPTRLLQLGATGLNGSFVLANLVKDQVFAGITSKHPMYTSLLNPFNFVNALYASTGKGELYDEWMRSGSAFTSFDISREGLPATVARIQSQKNLKTRVKYIARHPGELLRTVEDIVGTTERLTRIQQYEGTKKALLDQGVEPIRAQSMAAEASRANTGDFSRHGEFGRYLNAVIPFFNAGIQGARSLRESFMNDTKGTSLRFAASVGTPVAVATMWNVMDPGRKAVYDDIQDYEKDSNIIFVVPNSQQDERKQYDVIEIPLTPGLSNIASIIRRQIEGTNQLNPQGLMQVANDLVTAGTSLTLPIGAEDTRKFVNQITPQAIKIPLEGLTNQNLFTGNEIVPSYMKDLPPEQQVYDNTSGTTRAIGKMTGQSPLMVTNMLNTTLGGLGRQGLNAVDTVAAKAGLIPETQIGGKSLIEDTVGRFTKAPGGKQKDMAYQMIADQKAGKDMTGKQITLPGTNQKMGGVSTTSKKLTQFERDAIKFNLENNNSEYMVQDGIGYYIGDNGDLATIDPAKFKINSSDDSLVKKDKKAALISMTKKIYTDNTLSQESKVALLNSLGATGDTVYQAAYNTDEISNMKADDPISKLRKEDAAYTKTNAILKDLENGDLDEANATKLLDSMGVKAEDASYHYIASFDKSVRTAIIEKSVDGYSDRKEWLNSLIQYRKAVNGKMILDSTVLTELYNDGLITKDERKLLNAIELDENGEPSVKKSSGLGSGSDSANKTAAKAMGTALVNASKATRRTTKASVSPVKQKDYSNYKPAKVVPVNASRASMPTPKIKLRKVSK